MKKSLLLLFALSFGLVHAFAQNTFPATGAAGIGTTSPNASALLDVTSTSKGVLVPRMTKNQRDAIATPATGLLIYQTNSNPGFYYYTGTAWTAVSAAGANKTLGNLAGTTAVSSSLLPGTTDALDLGSATLKWRNIYASGSVQQTSLSGTGTRPVFADATGNLVLVPPVGSSTGTNSAVQAIPDFSCTGVVSTITLSGLQTSVASSLITVTLNITHPSVHDLDIYLIAPDGSILNLVRSSASGANFTNTSFNDNSGRDFIRDGGGTSPYSDVFPPDGNLSTTTCGITPTTSAFSGIGGGTINPNGIWTLKVYDNTAGNTGSLINWTVSVVATNTIEGVWGLKGNSGNGTNNFVGTTDNQPLRFKVNSLIAGEIDVDATTANTSYGSQTLANNASGFFNTGIGFKALFSNTTGTGNTANGFKALFSNTTGFENTANGKGALGSNTTGNLNTANGIDALGSNTTGSNNIANGNGALVTNTAGNNNIADGNEALAENQTGNNNTADGTLALLSNTTGNENSALGYESGRTNVAGSFNTFIGDSANAATGNLSNATAIGAKASVSASNSLVLGSINGVNGATSSVKVGIGVSTPLARLHVSVNGTSGISPFGGTGILLDDNANTYIAINTPSSKQSGLLFGNGSSNSEGAIVFNNSANLNGLQLNAGNTTRMTITSGGNVGIGLVPTHLLQLSSDDAAKPGTGTWTIVSDERLKKNIEPFKDGLDLLKKIKPVWFEYNGKAGLPTGTKYAGIIAQDMQKIAPYMIGTHTYKDTTTGKSTDYLDYNPNSLFYILVNSVKQLSGQNDSLKNANAQQQQQINSQQQINTEQQQQINTILQKLNELQLAQQTCCDKANNIQSTNNQNVILAGNDVARLEQNAPNPFNHSTVIGYTLPQKFNTAQIMITDKNGKTLKIVNVSGAGKGTVNVEASTLAAGAYNYSLLVDGKLIDTKQMVLAK